MDEETRKRRLEKIIELFRSWSGPAPDYDNLDFSSYHQTEDEYQKEQRQWLENLRRKKKERRNEAVSSKPEEQGRNSDSKP